VDFFFAGGDLAIASEDEEGVLRLFAYDPSGELQSWHDDTAI